MLLRQAAVEGYYAIPPRYFGRVDRDDAVSASYSIQ